MPLGARHANANVTPQPPQPPAPSSLISREERIEYRDQDGNLLDEAQVKAMEGEVSFKTRYETRTRIVDAYGNEISEGIVEGVAPPHPDVEGRNPETAGGQPGSDEARDQPATADAKEDVGKERKVEKGQKQDGKPRPASEGNEATR